jgi:hypothetical protein
VTWNYNFPAPNAAERKRLANLPKDYISRKAYHRQMFGDSELEDTVGSIQSNLHFSWEFGSITFCMHNSFQILKAFCYRSHSHRIALCQHERLILKGDHVKVLIPSEAPFANHVNTFRNGNRTEHIARE